MRRFDLRRALTLAPLLALALAVAGGAFARGGSSECVDPSTESWTQDDTRPGGTVTFTNAYDGPPTLRPGSLELKTPALDTAAKAGLYNHTMLGTPLRKVYNLQYWTYQAAGNLPHANASFQLQIDVNGAAAGGFTTLVFEPYWNPEQGAIVSGAWQRWEVDAGLFWSSRTVTDVPTCALVAGAGGPPLYTLAQVQAGCPNAVVVGVGVNVGTFNPGYTVATDGVRFNSTEWDFEVSCSREG
jgi:hypothetical protein